MINTKIKDKRNCAGCYACVNKCPQKCISMKIDKEGFWYPEVDNNKCMKCGNCIDVCPVINKTTGQKDLLAYACVNKDEPTRMNSSSGGIFTLLAEQILRDKGVVFGARFNEKFEVEHSYIESKEDISRFQGAKYVQSKIGKTYKQAKEFLEKGRKVLFTGTPCQIGGLRSYLKKNYKNLFCVDIVCHGVPSPVVWKKYLEYREEIAQSSIKKICFRDKQAGWKSSSISFWFLNNKKYQSIHNKDPYMIAFLKNICLRPSCYVCQFKDLYGQGDITLGDFWGIENILPNLDDNKGVSLVLVNSDNGKDIFKKIQDKTLYYKVNLDDAILYNSPIIKSVNYNPKREKFLKELDLIKFDELVKKHCSDSLSVIIFKKVKHLLHVVLLKCKLLFK
ncbi:MAG: Coenzyme F420 hydrogenase/dehydrogenase, beta subunit C-terminal domain [Candidatus Pacebacteria bacterium]|nr:Coenzyme F420 hydrogenase/dehydrogenase, beta subunit C-terminal domain [Candidatus Paceibacterota bacterium]